MKRSTSVNVFTATACAFLTFVLPRATFAEFQLNWARNTAVAAGQPRMAIDGQGNIYVVATASANFLTIKYAPDGTQFWSQNFGDSREEYANAIAADGAGNVWVSGSATTNGLVTIKSNPSGTLLWTRRFGGTNNISGGRSGLVVDSAGNAYVVGGQFGEGIVIKYSTDGAELWVRRYSVPDYWVQLGTVALDSAGNLIASGDVHAAGGVAAFLILKYDSAGNLLWSSKDDWGGNNNFLSGMVLDADGNVYVAGSSFLTDANSCCRRHHSVTAKYSATGERSWVAIRPPYEGCNGVAQAVRVDSQGNVIVTGYEEWLVTADDEEVACVTVKYDSAGTELWSARSLFRSPSALAVDDFGNAYVGGWGDPYIQQGFFMVKYAPNGSQISEYTAPAGGVNDLLLDRSGNVYATDTYGDGINPPIFEVRKFSQTLNPSQPTAVIVPSFQRAAAGSDVILTPQVTGPGPFTYQWRKFLTGLSRNGTGASLQLTSARVEDTGNYSVIVSNSAGYAISTEARLEVYTRPRIFNGPLDQYVATGKPVTFSPNIINDWGPLWFQWYFNGIPIPGATNGAFTLASAQPENVGSYSFVVTNLVGSATSRHARLQLFSSVTSVAAYIYGIDMPDFGPAYPYPSSLTIDGATGTISKLVVTLTGLTHTAPSDLDILLVGPGGQNVVLMSDAGRSTELPVSLIFDDDAPSSLPPPLGVDNISSGTFKPTNYASETDEVFPNPAPHPPHSDSLSIFNGTDPNGTWRLFIVDDQPENSGTLDGWGLTFIGVDGDVKVGPRIYYGPVQGGIRLSWDPAPGFILEHSTSLANPNWSYLTDADEYTSIIVPLGSSSDFFRLTQP